MDNSTEEFRKLRQQIMSQECKPLMSEEEIHFDELAMEVMELVDDRWGDVVELINLITPTI